MQTNGDLEKRKVLQSIFGHSMRVDSFMFILLFIFATTWIASTLYDIAKKFDEGYLTLFLFLIISIFILYKMYNRMKNLVESYSTEDIIDIKKIDVGSHKVLIIFLSNVNNKIMKKIDFNKEIEKGEANKWLNISYNSWKMSSISIEKSHTELNTLYVLTSSDSSKQFKQFKKIIEIVEESRNFKIVEKKVNDIDDITEYKRIFHSIYEEHKDKDEKIAIDVTSGIKLYSIAGSYYALSFNKVIQYINFQNNKYNILQYNNNIVENT